MRTRKLLILTLGTLLTMSLFAQQPKLVVGIVVDQMRQDYITRFWELYGDGGFKRMVQQGYSFDNAHYEYAPTVTGPGHAHVFSGANPAVHGIIGNEWFDRKEGKLVYCAEDKTVQTVGSPSNNGQMSPRRMMATTIGDELRLHSNFQSKVIGIALKDRGAILSAGHLANAAYWFDGPTGNFISSTYYMNDLPEWVKNFNKKELPDQYLNQDWTLLRPSSDYEAVCDVDNSPYEGLFKGEEKPVFPHQVTQFRDKYNSDLVRSVPAGNTLSFDFARAAIAGEGLGQGPHTDMLTLSLSTPDYIGHMYAPRAVEVADQYLRLDRDIASFLIYLDSLIGKDNYLVFLSADHAAADNHNYLSDRKYRVGNFKVSADSLQLFSKKRFRRELVLAFDNLQLYFDHAALSAAKLDRETVSRAFAEYLMNLDGVSRVATAAQLTSYDATEPLMQRIQRGYHPQRSGDLAVILHPGWIEMSWQATGTTHASPYNYDSRVPLLWYGKGIPAGHTSQKVAVADIAPTLAMLLKVNLPNAAFGQSLEEWFR